MHNSEKVMYVGTAMMMVDCGHVAGSGQRVREVLLDAVLLAAGSESNSKPCARSVR